MLITSFSPCCLAWGHGRGGSDLDENPPQNWVSIP
jgi:hypothetical protein